MATRVLGRTESRRRRFLLAPLFLLTLAAVLVVAGAQAVDNDNLFELGPSGAAPFTTTTATNIEGDGLFANGPDWKDLFTTTGGLKDVINADGTAGSNGIADYIDYGGSAAGFIKDDTAAGGAKDRSTFSGAGTSNKNSDAISTNDCTAGFDPDLTGSACAPWAWDKGDVPAKDDLTNVYSYATVPSSGALAGHLILYAGLEREDPSGTSHIDVEFFQDPVALANADANGNCVKPAGANNCKFTGHRTNGDTILSMEFTNGGALGSVNVREWIDDEYVLVATLAGTGCIGEDGNPGDDLCAFNNEITIPNGGWQSFNNHGQTITSLPANAFTEVGVDVTELFDGTTPCISTFMGKTRSSDSFTAELKDFAGPAGFPLCSGQISISPSAVNEVGAPHTFTVKVQRKIGTSVTPAPVGTKPTVTLTAANGAVVSNVVNNCASTGTDANGECTVSFTSNSTGTVTGSATATFSFGGQTFTVTTNGIAPNSAPAVKRFVDGKISIGPSATNGIGEPHTFTVTVQQDDGLTAAQGGDGVTGYAPVSGDNPTVTLTNDATSNYTNVTDNCATTGTNSSGQCTVSFTSNTPGTVTGSASATWTLNGVTLTRATDGTHGSTGNATKVFIAGSLAWFKNDNAGSRQGGATFQVCRTADRFGNLISNECQSVIDNLAPDTDTDNGEFKLVGLPLGHYTVKETTAPSGYVPDPSTKEADLTLANPNATISVVFVNQRPIVKVTAFGYTNEPTGTPTAGIVSGHTVFTVKAKNYGGTGASATLSGTLAATTDASSGTLSCVGGNSTNITGTLAPGAELTFTLDCTYSNLNDGAKVTADLNTSYTTNGLARVASGSPAQVFFTVQSD
jgi:hypothetical protein